MLLLIARLLLAGVFAVAAVAKLADRRGSRRAVTEFGVPEPLAPALAVLVPLFELAVATALLPASSARFGALGALLLLSGFTVAIARTMLRGEAPDCHCFGQLHSAPAGWRALGRNAVLAGLATLVVLAGWHRAGTSAVAWAGSLSDAGVVALAGAVAFGLLAATGGAFLLALLRQHGRLLLRLDELEARLDQAGLEADGSMPTPPEQGLPVGAPAPDFALAGLYGETVTLEALMALEKPVLLVFTDPDCGPCNALLPQIADWQRQHASALTVALLTRGSADDNRPEAHEHGVRSVWLDSDHSVYDAYQAWGTPTAVIVDPQGRIASETAGGADSITALVERAVDGQIVVIHAGQPPSAGD